MSDDVFTDMLEYDLEQPDAGIPAAIQPTGVEARVCADIAARQQLGIAKYGVTVEGNTGDLKYWMQNLLEEILDASIYLKRAIIELENAQHHSSGKMGEAGQVKHHAEKRLRAEIERRDAR